MFFYHLDIPKHHTLYGRRDKIVLWGSCFAQELKRYLYEDLYDVEGSPYGIMYNPISMASGMSRVLNNEPPTRDELLYISNEWHSFMHHGSYSSADQEMAYNNMSRDFNMSKNSIQSASLLVLTFGTAYVYETLDTGQVVNNCHKLPTNKHFSRRRITVEEIVSKWIPILNHLKEINPQLEIVLTVSPICHYRDGAHDSRLSKAILHIAVDELCKEYGVYYFPAYEIMQDELREYRFYKDDLVHPNERAVRYILERFTSAYIDIERERSLTDEWHSIKGMLEHRPMTTHVPTIHNHYHLAQEKLINLREKLSHPYLDEQLDGINNRIKKLSSYE